LFVCLYFEVRLPSGFSQPQLMTSSPDELEARDSFSTEDDCGAFKSSWMLWLNERADRRRLVNMRAANFLDDYDKQPSLSDKSLETSARA